MESKGQGILSVSARKFCLLLGRDDASTTRRHTMATISAKYNGKTIVKSFPSYKEALAAAKQAATTHRIIVAVKHG